MASGELVLPDGASFDIQIANLLYKIVFVSDGGEQNIAAEDQDESGLTLMLYNFNNPLGTSLRPLQIGVVNGKPIYLTMFVQAPAGDRGPRVASYSVLWGGSLG